MPPAPLPFPGRVLTQGYLLTPGRHSLLLALLNGHLEAQVISSPDALLLMDGEEKMASA